MDVVLQVLDTLVLDRVYATLLPATIHSTYSNGTITRPIPKTIVPATSYFHLQPSRYAWMSDWDRECLPRQIISLFAITW